LIPFRRSIELISVVERQDIDLDILRGEGPCCLPFDDQVQSFKKGLAPIEGGVKSVFSSDALLLLSFETPLFPGTFSLGRHNDCRMFTPATKEKECGDLGEASSQLLGNRSDPTSLSSIEDEMEFVLPESGVALGDQSFWEDSAGIDNEFWNFGYGSIRKFI